ncbi:VCBS repeat-containing protein [Myxococcota bacterium]|nr:VCBS repeat-containing protein [Myxococcota bacterium]MBU1534807.1 VCBS repeat-containing protein [Myxococcota bacterium]
MKRVLLLFAAISLFSSCDWREFDDLSKSATVQVIDGPDSYSGSIFGQVVTPLSEGNFRAPGLYVVAGTGEGSFALVDFRSGTPKTSILPVQLDSAFTVQALVSLQGAEGAWRFAASSLSHIYFFTLTEDENGFTLTRDQSLDISMESEPGFGRNILPVDQPGESYAVASTHKLFYAAQDATVIETLQLDTLTLPTDDGVGFNVPFLGTFVHGGVNWLVTGGSTNPGAGQHWAMLFIDLDDTSHRVLYTPAQSLTGAQVCTVKLYDLDGDSHKDLVVGAGQNIYVFMNDPLGVELPFASDPDYTLHDQSRNIGQIIEFGDLTGNNQPEIIASDPSYQAQSDDELGSVSIFSNTFIGGTSQTVTPLLSLSPNSKDEKKFGSSLIALPTVNFPGRDELVIGGMNSSYLFYITGIEGDNSPAADPR